jgi:hypothetical protein
MNILFKAADDFLSDICSTKLNIKSLHSKFNENNNELKLDEINPTMIHEEDDFSLSSIMMKRKKKSRGSSLGQGVNVFVLGILDCVPHLSIFSKEFTETHYYRSKYIQSSVNQYLTAILSIEWLASMMTECIRPGHKIQCSNSIVQNKDILRRLFAYSQSSLLEVCRFQSATKWTSKVLIGIFVRIFTYILNIY